MVQSHWLSPGLRQGPEPRHGQMGCTVSCRTFPTAPKQGQRPTPIVPQCSGSGLGLCPGTGQSQCDYTTKRTSELLSLVIVMYLD